MGLFLGRLFGSVFSFLVAIHLYGADDGAIQRITGLSPSGPFSQALSVDLSKVKDLVFVSGQVPSHPKSDGMSQESIEASTRQVLDSIEDLLIKAGTDWSHVVRVDVFLQNFERDLQGMNAAYRKKFSEGRFPVRQTVGVVMDAENLVEISCIAVVPQKRPIRK